MRKDKTKSRAAGSSLLVTGLALLAFAYFGHHGSAPGGVLIAGLICVGMGGFAFASTLGTKFSKSRYLPKKEIMRLAEQRKGMLTVSEITTALDIDPNVVLKTLQALAKDGIATQRWAEFRKNLWEFPDYLTLPIPESIELAKAKGGRLTLNDLVASGHSAETARQTLDVLNSKGLAQEDPANSSASDPAIIVTTQ